MDTTVARLNIGHYRKRLATEQDETKRQTLMIHPRKNGAALSIAPATRANACTSIRFLVSALIQLPRMRRHGNTRARLLSVSRSFRLSN